MTITLRPYQNTLIERARGKIQQSLGGDFSVNPRRDSAGTDQSANIRKNESSALGFFICKMKTCKTCGIEKPLDDFHIRKESGKPRTECKACWRIKTNAWSAANIQKRRAIALKWAKSNYDYIRSKKAEYRAKDPVGMRKWSIENPEKMKACRDRWENNNKDRKAAHAAARRARVRNAIPSWADLFFIEEAFHIARLRTKMLGSEWEVDHIVPLAGKTVCGLHVISNIRVIPRSENRKKGHHTWPDKP